MEEQLSIAAISTECLANFQRLIECFQVSPQYKSDYRLQSVLRENAGRFNVWAGNCGAHQRGKSSLDYRLRDSATTRAAVVRFLHDLQNLLIEATSIVSGTRNPHENDIPTDDEYNTVLQAMSSYVSDAPELDLIAIDTAQTVDCLYRISINLRARSSGNRYAKAASVDISSFLPFDIEHVRQKFPGAKNQLCWRMGRAISKRRQYLKYREQHAAKLAQDLSKGEDTEIALSETTASTFIDPIDRPDKAARVEESAPVSTFDDAASETTYATVLRESGRLRLPPMPKEASMGQAFECPFCRKIMQLEMNRATHAWMKHLFSDLQPYVCTFNECEDAEETFESRHRWFAHELKFHRRVWMCHGHCDRKYPSQTSFLEHVRESGHIAANQLSALAEMCEGPIDTASRTTCPLCCEDIIGTKKLEKHLGRHMEEVALFALPTSSFDSEQEMESESSDTDELSDDRQRTVNQEALSREKPIDASALQLGRPPSYAYHSAPKTRRDTDLENLSGVDTDEREQADREFSTFDPTFDLGPPFSEQDDREFSTFDPAIVLGPPFSEQAAFAPFLASQSPDRAAHSLKKEEPYQQQNSTAITEDVTADWTDSTDDSTDLTNQISPDQRWAQIRKNAAERAARESEEQSRQTEVRIEEGEASQEETIESRVARIKARVAELTGNTEKS